MIKINFARFFMTVSLGASVMFGTVATTASPTSPPSPQADAYVWGPVVSGLQCGILAGALRAHDLPRIQIAIRNEGTAPVIFWDDELAGLEGGLITRRQDGSVISTLHYQPEFQPYSTYNGTRPSSKLGPKETLVRDFFTFYAKASDPYTITFDGAIKSKGVTVTTTLQCGPVPFSKSALPT
jgi:hypothetical protein